MSNVDSRMAQIEAALNLLRETMESDGYSLLIVPNQTGLALHVKAGEGACEECLVPKQLFVSMVTQALDDAAVSYSDLSLEVVYPLDRAQH